MAELTGHRVKEAADHRRGAAAHDHRAQVGASWPGRRPECPGQGQSRDPVPGRNQHQVGKQGGEQLAVSTDGLPLQRDMRAVICLGQVFQADAGQPGQAGRRASQLHQGGDALAVGHLGGAQQHPALGQEPQPGPGSMEADLKRNAVADDRMVYHGTQSTCRASGWQRSQVPIRAGRRSRRSRFFGPSPRCPRIATLSPAMRAVGRIECDQPGRIVSRAEQRRLGR
jgi:hypothetical protein